MYCIFLSECTRLLLNLILMSLNDYNNSNFTSLYKDFNTTREYKLVIKQKQWKKERQQGEPTTHPNKLFKQRNKTHETQCIKAKTNTSNNVNEIESKVETKKQSYM